MTKEEIMEFINANLACNLATVEGDKPHVRGMMAYKADENGIIFHTGSAKDLYKQIQTNPNVEVCFYSAEKNIQVRVEGKAVIKDDMALKEEIVEARPFLQPWVEARGYEMLAVFQVTECSAYAWSMETNFAAKVPIKLF